VPANIVILRPSDNVGVALRDIDMGQNAFATGNIEVLAAEKIPIGHKVALRNIAHEDQIIRCGMPVGRAIADIPCGALVHVHNISSQYINNDFDHYE
jgi:hypothetical protein